MVNPPEAERDVAPIPPENVEVAVDVLRIEPPETKSPALDESPAVDIPPLNVEVAEPVLSILLESFKLETLSPNKVEVALFVWSIAPPEIVRPAEAERDVAEIPPDNVEVAEPVNRKTPLLAKSPLVIVIPEEEVSPEEVKPKRVEVAPPV